MAEKMNESKLREWLKDKPQEVAVAIAARSALRSAPFLSRLIVDWPKYRNRDDDLSSWLRCIITSGVAPESPNPEVKRAARAATDAAAVRADAAAAFAAAFAADAAAAAAVRAAFAAADADADAAAAVRAAFAAAHADAVWDAVIKDVKYLEETRFEDIDGFMARPIWPDGAPEEVAEVTERFLDYLASKPELSFWGPWYIRMRDGNPPDWEMQKKIALIPDEDWEKGAKHVSGEIARIEAEYLAKATPFAEEIQLNPETGRLISVPVQMENAALYTTALDKVRDALDDLRPNGVLPQHCNALEPIAKRLDRTLSKYADNPQRVHDDFLLSAKQVNHLLGVGEVAASEEVDALRTDLITGADDIRAADEIVRASVDARLKLRIEEMRVEDTELAAVALDDLAEISEGSLEESSREDAEVLRAIRDVVGSHAPPIGGVTREESIDAIYRTGATASRADRIIRDVIAQGDKIAGAYDRGEKWAKAAVGVTTVVRWFLRIFMGG